MSLIYKNQFFIYFPFYLKIYYNNMNIQIIYDMITSTNEF